MNLSSVDYYLIIIAIMSVITFITWGVDKAAAINGKWRTPEKVLLLLTFLGGAPGAILGMNLFRHKTRKPVFRLALWIAGLLQLTLLILLLTGES